MYGYQGTPEGTGRRLSIINTQPGDGSKEDKSGTTISLFSK